MARARAEQGVAEWTLPGGRTMTRATTTCCHCNGITVIAQGATPDECGGFCMLCHRPTCRTCAGKECRPFERQLEAIERRGRLLAAVETDAAQTRTG